MLHRILFCFIWVSIMISCGEKGNKTNNNTETATNTEETFTPIKVNNDTGSGRVRPLTEADKARVAKNSQKNGQGNTISDGISNNAKNVDQSKEFAPSPLAIMNGVPDACSLITASEIESIFGLSAGIVKQKDASSTKSPYTRSCFYRWDGAVPNTGILLQVQANPVPEEYDGWVSLFVESKRTSGEKTLGSDETFLYDKLEGLGDAGAYSHRLGKYIWRSKNDYVFMIAFNTNSDPEVQMKNALTIGNIMMKNYKG